MPYMALYRELRPKVFEDVIGQENIIKTIKNQVISGKIPHAYLFCGTHGTGKTSTAKILSKAVNCLNPKNGNPCNECEICREINGGTLIDVVEIDAASNRKVENARDLIDTVQYPPHRAKYKVYIIDEVHMLQWRHLIHCLKPLRNPLLMLYLSLQQLIHKRFQRLFFQDAKDLILKELRLRTC